LKKFRNIIVHAPVFDLNPSSFNEGVRSITLRYTMESLHIAGLIDGEFVTIHPGRRTVSRKATRKDSARMNKYLEICKNYSRIKGIPLAIENLEKRINALCWSPSSIKRVVEKYDLYFTLDIDHALKHSEQLALRFIELLEDRLRNIHVSLSDGLRNHAPSRFNSRVKKVLSHLGCDYEGYLTIELDDLAYENILSLEEKLNELRQEKEFLESIFRK
jgi:sugar phosphate isomerase/epimerase